METEKVVRNPGERRCTRCRRYGRYTWRLKGGVYCKSCMEQVDRGRLGEKRARRAPGMAQLAELGQSILHPRMAGRR